MSVKSGLKSFALILTVSVTSFVISTNTETIKGWTKLFDRMARAAASELNPGKANSSKIEDNNHLESVGSLPNLQVNKTDESVRKTMFAGPQKLKIIQHARVLKKGLTNTADTTDNDVVTDRDFIDIQVEGDTNGKTFIFFDKTSGTLGSEHQSNDVYRVFVGDASRELTIQAQELDSSPAVKTNEIKVEVNRKKPTFSLTNDSGKMYDAATGKEVTDKTNRIVVGQIDKLTLKGQSSFPLGEFRVVLDRSGQVVSGDSTVPANGANQPKDIPVSMSNLGGRDSVYLTLQRGYTDTVKKSFEIVVESDPIEIVIDRKGPDLLSVIYDESNRSTGPFVTVSFKDNDLNKGSVIKEALKLYRIETGPQEKTEVSSQVNIDVKNSDDRNDRFFVTLPSTLNPGEYEIVLDDVKIPDSTRVKDRVGNVIGLNSGSRQSARFVIFPQGKTGAQVEFPQYLPPKEGNREQPFNPDDFVVTRVARLYYMRDAHRVAQIINRNVRSYNKAAVDVMERVAEKARTEADNLVDARREAERKAVRAAEELRRKESQLDEIQQQYGESAARSQRIADLDSSKKANDELIEELDSQIAGTVDSPEKVKLQKERNDLRDANEAVAAKLKTEQDLDKAAPKSMEQLKSDLTTYQQQVESLRSEMLDSQESLAGAQSKEDRAKEDQFRKEVSAAKEDPDTYVPGKLDSVDPVTQVSVSVIGEGVIQLRGPIKGVNKIRTMINQIDSPLGQVKIGISTVQINGEHGDRMEKVAQRIEGQIDISRFLASHSLMLMRKAVQEVAAEVAVEACGPGEGNLQPGALRGHTQIDRDRRYLYAFFGRDFIDSLFAMNSEFLYTGNHLLSLNSMDNISLNRALFVLALARNDVRERIIERFMQHIQTELPQAEYEYRVTTGLVKHDGKHAFKNVTSEALKRYIFRNFRSVFTSNAIGADTLNPVQLEFLRMAQIFKSQMVAEVELKQRITERGLIQDRVNDEDEQTAMLNRVQSSLRKRIEEQLENFVNADAKFMDGLKTAELQIAKYSNWTEEANAIDQLNTKIKIQDDEINKDLRGLAQVPSQEQDAEFRNRVHNNLDETKMVIETASQLISKIEQISVLLSAEEAESLEGASQSISDAKGSSRSPVSNLMEINTLIARHQRITGKIDEALEKIEQIIVIRKEKANDLYLTLRDFGITLQKLNNDLTKTIKTALNGIDDGDDSLARNEELIRKYAAINQRIMKDVPADSGRNVIENALKASFDSVVGGLEAEQNLRRSVRLKNNTRANLDQRKLLDHLIDEKEEKYIELVEGTRSYIANMDAYIKRMVIAMEDDCRIQYYDPAFAKIRGAAREWDVTLGQVERTTILTNNRQFAKVEPAATMEFDLPKRDIMITEAMKGAKAMVQDYGALLQDPTFLTATSMLSGSPPTGSYSGSGSPFGGMANQGLNEPAVKSVLPTLPSVPEERVFNQFGYKRPDIGASLEALIPDPAIYKFETGTGFEIRPVIQPDGDSVIYDFNYMYTTNVREPVRPDEKHLGRVKRQFVNTQVQTSTYELRELGRYTVALKASRTGRGVPLFEDIPGLGLLFRPLPSAESSLQQNIILGQSTVYPTLFDLMGLRWAPYVVDLDDQNLQEEEFVVRGRRKAVTDWTLGDVSKRVDGFLQIDEKERRSDFYRIPGESSPYHPNGYEFDRIYPPTDPTGKNYLKDDPRPEPFDIPRFNPKGGRIERRPVQDPRLYGEHGEIIQDFSRTPHSEIQPGIPSLPVLPDSAQPSDSSSSVPGAIDAISRSSSPFGAARSVTPETNRKPQNDPVPSDRTMGSTPPESPYPAVAQPPLARPLSDKGLLQEKPLHTPRDRHVMLAPQRDDHFSRATALVRGKPTSRESEPAHIDSQILDKVNQSRNNKIFDSKQEWKRQTSQGNLLMRGIRSILN